MGESCVRCDSWHPNAKFGVASLLMVVWLLLGATAFMYVEQDKEKVDATKFVEAEITMRNLLKNLPERLADFEVLVGIMRNRTNVGSPQGLNWKFPSSMYYAGLLMTTIGAANYEPRTPGGKAMTVIYSLVAIPLFVFFLSMAGERLMTLWRITRTHCCGAEKRTDLRVYLGVVSLLVVFLFAIAAPLYHVTEKWSIGDSFYFCSMNLLTLGTPEFTPATQLARGFSLVFFTCGLVLLSTLIHLFHSVLSREIREHFGEVAYDTSYEDSLGAAGAPLLASSKM